MVSGMVRGFWPTVLLWWLASSILFSTFGDTPEWYWGSVVSLPTIAAAVFLSNRLRDRARARRSA